MAIGFFFLFFPTPLHSQVPTIKLPTYKFLLYTSSQHHNSLLSQLPVTSQHYIQFPTSQIPTTNLEQQVPNTKLPKDIYIYIYIYKFYTSQKIYKKNFFTFKTPLKQPQAVSSNITNGTFYVKKNIYILTFVFTTCLECPQFHLLPFWTETLSCPLHGKTAQIILCQVKFAKFLLAIHNTLNMNLKL